VTTVVVIGDVHGNARALRAALDHARSGPMDRLVLVGDLLTYGHDVAQVLDLVDEAQARHDATLLIGNHDQMYFDLAENRRNYLDRLPSWIRESVLRTVEQLDLERFRTRFRWSEQLELERALFAHANPFGAGDWTYLDSAEQIARATTCLRARGLRLGVFGHTHRPRWAGTQVGAEHRTHASDDEPLVINAGSVGQPRDGTARAVIVRIALEPATITASFEHVAYDVEAHLTTLRQSGLTDETFDRLAAYFRVASIS